MASAPEGTDPGELLRDMPTVFWNFAVTDSGGGFELAGLCDRNYRLAVLDPQSLLRFESDPIAAGTIDALVRVPGSCYVEKLEGRVLSLAGRPVPGAWVAPCVDVLTVRIDEHSRSTFDYPAKPVQTDAEGRFSFERLPREHAYLKISGEDVLPTEWARGGAGGIGKAAGEQPGEIVIRVELSFHVQVEFAPGSADELRALDEQGRPVPVHVFEGTSSMTTDSLSLEGGRSKILVVGENTATLLLFKAGAEVRRAPLTLAPGQLNRVQL
jgi:hypothetical protein